MSKKSGKYAAEQVYVYDFNEKVMHIHPTKDPDLDPKLHFGLRPQFTTMRHEIHIIDQLNLKHRRAALKEFLKKEMDELDLELRTMGLAFITTQL